MQSATGMRSEPARIPREATKLATAKSMPKMPDSGPKRIRVVFHGLAGGGVPVREAKNPPSSVARADKMRLIGVNSEARLFHDAGATRLNIALESDFSSRSCPMLVFVGDCSPSVVVGDSLTTSSFTSSVPFANDMLYYMGVGRSDTGLASLDSMHVHALYHYGGHA